MSGFPGEGEAEVFSGARIRQHRISAFATRGSESWSLIRWKRRDEADLYFINPGIIFPTNTEMQTAESRSNHSQTPAAGEPGPSPVEQRNKSCKTKRQRVGAKASGTLKLLLTEVP